MAKVSKSLWGKTVNGEDVLLFKLENAVNAYVTVTNFGGAIQAICVPDKSGKLRDVVLGFDSLNGYETQDKFIGATIGRCANRIARGEFSLGDKKYSLYKNDGNNHLHGGKIGFDKRVWSASEENGTLVLHYTSPDGEEGYPGNLEVSVRFSFSDFNELRIDHSAISDMDTVVNLTNHSYFNLNGSGIISDTKVKIFSDYFTENDEESLPTGKILPVLGTPFDFTKEKELGRDIFKESTQIKFGNGYDHNFVIRGARDAKESMLRPAAAAYSEKSGISLECSTTMPGVQLYTGNYLDGVLGKNGIIYGSRNGFCLETQYFPNSLEFENFPSPILKKDERYLHTTVYKFSKLFNCNS